MHVKKDLKTAEKEYENERYWAEQSVEEAKGESVIDPYLSEREVGRAKHFLILLTDCDCNEYE